LAAVTQLHADLNGALEAVFVVDGSPDKSYALLHEQLPKCSFASQLLLLSRNFGSFAAIRAGLAAGRGQTFAVMAADLQEPPELVVRMQHLLAHEPYDVVVGQRISRNDPFLSGLLAKAFWWLFRRTVMPEMPPGGVDIFACNAAFRSDLLRLSEHHSSLVAQVFWLGYRRGTVPYTRQVRQHGVSAWTLRKKLRYLSDSIFSFTDLPIRVLIFLGGSVATMSGLFGLLVVISRMMGFIAVSGYSITMLAIIFLGASNLLAVGLVGSYAWRTYENTKQRPLHVLMRQHEFAAQPAQHQARGVG
jgi:glycosyltransferase involved in cell wall biosynthesis